jgi:hypothetical protein
MCGSQITCSNSLSIIEPVLLAIGPQKESGDIILTVENPLCGTLHSHLEAGIHKGLAGSRGHYISYN